MSVKKHKQIDYRTNAIQDNLTKKLAKLRGVQRGTMLRIVLSRKIEERYLKVKDLSNSNMNTC